MGIIQVNHTTIALNSLEYIKSLESSAPVSDENVPSVPPVDAVPQEEIGFTDVQSRRAKHHAMSHSNGRKVRGMDNIKTTRNAFHQIQKLLQKTSKMLMKFAQGDFDAKDIRKFNNKIDKIISKFNHIAMKSNFDLTEIQNQLPDEVVEIDESAINDLTANEKMPDDTSGIPISADSAEIISDLENIEIPAEVTEPEITSIPDIEIDAVPIDGIESTEQTIANVDTAIDDIDNMVLGFTYAQFQMESSLVFLSLPDQSSETGVQNNQTYFTSFQMSYESTIVQMLSNAGESIIAQTSHLNIDIVSLLI